MFFLFKKKRAYEVRISDWIQTCALPISWALRQLCAHYFLKPMKRKVLEKAHRFPGTIDVLRLGRVKTLREFDDFYTAPMHGYKNALDYWTRASKIGRASCRESVGQDV